MLFPRIPITGILVKPLVMAIWAIYGQNGHIGPYNMALMAMTNGLTNMPVMGIQGKSTQILTQSDIPILFHDFRPNLHYKNGHF